MTSEQVRQSPEAEPRFFYGYIVVLAALLIMVGIYGVYNAFGVFFKPVLTEFGWTRATISGAFSVSRIMQGAFAILMGTLSDKMGPRMVMIVCGILLGLGYVLMSQISAAWQLYLFFGVIIGIGMSGAYISLMSTIPRWFVRRRSMISGIVLSGGGIGGLIGPPTANSLIHAYDWRVSYIVLGSAVIVLVVLASQFLRRDPSQMGQLPYGEKEYGEIRPRVETVAFTLREVLRTKQFWLALATSFSVGFCMLTIQVHIAPHATDLGLSTASAANILAIIGGTSIVGRIIFGSFGDRIGNEKAYMVGFALMAVALFWLVPARQAWILYLFAAVYGFAMGGCTALIAPLVAGLFGLKSHGLILGVVSIGFTIGAAAGPFLAGYVFDVTGTYQVAFLVSAALAVTGIILTTLLMPMKKT